MLQHTFFIAVCDDDADFLTELQREIQAWDRERGQDSDVCRYADASALLNAVRSGKRFSLFLLDVMMEGMDGMELARNLREDGMRVPIIFLSTNRELAMYGYEMEALRYLSKPLDKTRLWEALNTAEQISHAQTILLSTDIGLTRVDTRDLLYAEVWERGVRLHLQNGSFLQTKTKIGALAQFLPEDQFMRCHQGYVVALNAIRALKSTDAVLLDGSLVPVSRANAAELHRRFIECLSV